MIANNVKFKQTQKQKKSGMLEDLLQAMLQEVFQPYGFTIDVPDEISNDLAYTMSSNTQYKFDVENEKDFSQFHELSSNESIEAIPQIKL